MLADAQAVSLPWSLAEDISILFRKAFTRHTPDQPLAEAFERVQSRAAAVGSTDEV
jgi:hypothetical protein